MLRNGIRELDRRRQALTPHRLLSRTKARNHAAASQTAVAATSNPEHVFRVARHDDLSQHLLLPRRGAHPRTVPFRRPAPASSRPLPNEPRRPQRTAVLRSQHQNPRDQQRSILKSLGFWPEAPTAVGLNDPLFTDLATQADRKADAEAEPEIARQDELEPSATETQQPRRKLGWRNISSKLSKSWRQLSPNILLKRVLDPHEDSQYWRRQVALARSHRLPIVLLQMFLRSEASRSPPIETGEETQEALLDLLPTASEWKKILAIMRENDHSPEKLAALLHVLQGETDEERCERALRLGHSSPRFIFNFVIRQSSAISKVSTLSSTIKIWRKICRISLEDASKASEPSGERDIRKKKLLAPSEFIDTLELLAHHCMCLEPRLMLDVADVAAEYISGTTKLPIPKDKAYHDQCLVFNKALKIFLPKPRLQAIQRSSPNAFLWESQRVLLAMSAEMERPLLVNREGFQAIRSVLSSLPKNQAEIRNALRHATTWPPYLKPGDGMDEVADPEDSWSRAVMAGTLMQEAGFSKEERDDALDIMSGMAMDGSPTIQQRAAIARERSLSIWEASIRATRNAHEAWQRFCDPPEADLRPGVAHYAAMFEKLMLREANSYTRALPGDKAMNFPVRQEANLTEFEKARLRPPSVAQLYDRMRSDGIRPVDNCLHILVANAESIETAHRYIDHSYEDRQTKWNLYHSHPDPRLLREIDPSLFAAYIQALTAHGSKRGGQRMTRAIRLASDRFETSKSPLAQFVWGTILKNLSQHHNAMMMSLGRQIKLLFRAVEHMGGDGGITLGTFLQFSKCVRKAARREIQKSAVLQKLDEARSTQDPMLRLFRKPSTVGRTDSETHLDTTPTQWPKGQPESLQPDQIFRLAASRMKELYHALQTQESESQLLFDKHRVAPLDRMAWRKDMVRSDHAHEYLLALAYVGEFEAMAAVLGDVIREWSQPDVLAALVEYDEPPPHADFFEALCGFRLLGEGMVGEEVVQALRGEVERSGLGLMWPDGEAMERYVAMQEDESILMLARVLEGVRERGHGVSRAVGEASA